MDKAAVFATQKREEFNNKKNEMIAEYNDHCTYFTQSFNNPELQQQARSSLANTIHSIYLKVLNRWNTKQAATTVDTLLGKMELELGEDLLERRNKGNPPSIDEF